MKIKLKDNHVAILRDEVGDIIGCFKSNENAMYAMEQAVSEHYVCRCSLVTMKDFEQPNDYHSTYLFRLLLEEEEVVELIMTYAPIY